MQMVSFNSADKQLTLNCKRRIKEFISNIFEAENKRLKKIDYIFCSDEYLLQINKNFLNHDYYTDIITFPLSDNNQPIEGEIYVSLDRVADNAKIHNNSFLDETIRVLFHGALHLCGYGDKTKKEIATMRNKEDFYINLFHVEQ